MLCELTVLKYPYHFRVIPNITHSDQNKIGSTTIIKISRLENKIQDSITIPTQYDHNFANSYQTLFAQKFTHEH